MEKTIEEQINDFWKNHRTDFLLVPQMGPATEENWPVMSRLMDMINHIHSAAHQYAGGIYRNGALYQESHDNLYALSDFFLHVYDEGTDEEKVALCNACAREQLQQGIILPYSTIPDDLMENEPIACAECHKAIMISTHVLTSADDPGVN